MKLPNLPAECIRRMLTDEEMINLMRKLSKSTMHEAILTMVSSYGINSYTIEELDKLGILNGAIAASIHLCNRYELTKEALELFDEVKSNTKTLQYFLKMIRILGQNLLKDQNFTRHILDTLVGPEWKEPDFYLYDDASLNLIDENLRRKKNISSILCDGLCIFDDIPEDRINKFYDALRRLMPYFKRRGFDYTIGDEVCISYKYKLKDFPISIPKPIQQYTHMYLERCIENNQLIIEKEFRISGFFRHVSRKELEDFLKRLKEKYPNTLEEDSEMPGTYVQWYKRREYNLPADLKGLANT